MLTFNILEPIHIHGKILLPKSQVKKSKMQYSQVHAMFIYVWTVTFLKQKELTHSVDGLYYLKNTDLGLEVGLNFNSATNCVTLANMETLNIHFLIS